MALAAGDIIVTHFDADTGTFSLLLLGTADAGEQVSVFAGSGSSLVWTATEEVGPGTVVTLTPGDGTADVGTVTSVNGAFDSADVYLYGASAGSGLSDFNAVTGMGDWGGLSSISADLGPASAGKVWAFYPDPDANASQILAAYTAGATSGPSFWAQVPVGFDYSLDNVPNAAPSGSGLPATVNGTEDIVSGLDLSGLTLADSDGDSLALTLSVDGGTLAAVTSGGVAVSVAPGGQEVQIAGTAAGINAYLDETTNILYSAPANANGTVASLTASVTDGRATTALGSVDVVIDAVNDAPEMTLSFAPVVTTAEDTGLVITGTVVSAADVEGDDLRLTFTAASGELTFIGTPGDISATSSGGAVTISGTIAALTSYLASTGLSFTPEDDASGPVSVGITLADAGGAAGTISGTTSFTIDVTAVDDPASLVDDSFASAGTGEITGNVFADNGAGADSDIDSALAVATVNGVDLATFNGSGSGLTMDADGSFTYAPPASVADLVAPSTGASNTTATEAFTYGTADGETASLDFTVTGTATSGLLLGTDGADTIVGGDGRNIVRAGDGGDSMTAGASASDWLDYRGSNAGVTVDLGAGTADGGHATGDTFSGFERIVGSSYADSLTGDDQANALRGGSGDDMLFGGGGNDVLRGDRGADMLDGGDGIDTADYSNSSDGVTVNLSGAATASMAGEMDTLVNIERVVGSAGDDSLTGNDEDNALKGAGGSDSLNGGGGRDVLVGGTGDDMLRGDLGNDVHYGGAGADTFVFASAAESNLVDGMDQIRDWEGGVDRIALEFVTDAASAFIGDAEFSGTGGVELRTRQAGDHIQLLADTDGDGSDDFRLTFLNTSTFSLDDIA